MRRKIILLVLLVILTFVGGHIYAKKAKSSVVDEGFVYVLSKIYSSNIPINTAKTLEHRMKGLSPFFVMFEEIPEQAQKAGLNEQELQTAIELRLRQFGINIISYDDMVKDPYGQLIPYLYIFILTDNIEDGKLFALRVSIRFRASGFMLMKNSLEPIYGDIWQGGFIHTCDKNELKTATKEGLMRNLDEFINDYLSVNPVTSPARPEIKSEGK